MNQTPLYAKFSSSVIEGYLKLNERQLFEKLLNDLKNKKYQGATVEKIREVYPELLKNPDFWDIQFKFFLFRNGTGNYKKELFELYTYWHERTPTPAKTKIFNIIHAIYQKELYVYARYYYHPLHLRNYLESWHRATITLKTWQKYKLFQISKEVDLIDNFFRGTTATWYEQMHQLFKELVTEIYEKQYLPRKKNKTIATLDESVLQRFFSNSQTRDDKKYLESNFDIPAKQFTKSLSSCLKEDFSMIEIDIHSPECLAKMMAILKYNDSFSAQTSRNKPKAPALWFHHQTVQNKNEVFNSLEYLFEYIHKYCPKNTWGDFKSIFKKGGASTKIDWNGDASILNFIFRKLRNHLKFEGKKWEVVSFYFNPNNKDTLQARKLESNSHYQDKELEKRPKLVISALS